MTRSPAFEDFSAAQLISGLSDTDLGAELSEVSGDPRANGGAEYETGYRAGWDDATQTAQQEQLHIRTELAHNLQDIGFGYHEARACVMRSLEPLLNEIIEKVFPELIRDTLSHHILEAALPMARAAADAPLEVVVAPINRPALEPVLAAVAQMKFIVREEATLGDGQVYLQSGTSELSLDFAETIVSIQTALTALSDINKETLKHG